MYPLNRTKAELKLTKASTFLGHAITLNRTKAELKPYSHPPCPVLCSPLNRTKAELKRTSSSTRLSPITSLNRTKAELKQESYKDKEGNWVLSIEPKRN